VIGDLDAQDEVLHIPGDRFQGSVIFNVQTLQSAEECIFDPGLNEEPAERLGSHHKSLRYRKSDGGHLTKRCSLSPYGDDIFLLYFFEPQNVGDFGGKSIKTYDVELDMG